MSENCICPRVWVGLTLTENRNWSDRCPEHGVGTPFFRGLKPKPFGYAGESGTTREEWLSFLAEPTEEDS